MTNNNRERADRQSGWSGGGRAEGSRGARMKEGPHRGKGPKGYKRSDDRIREDVNDRLSDDDFVDASDIDVRVEDGTVVLSGRVESLEAKRRAADLAEDIPGVANVENRLRTGQGFLENLARAVTAGVGDVTVGPENNDVDDADNVGKHKDRKS